MVVAAYSRRHSKNKLQHYHKVKYDRDAKDKEVFTCTIDTEKCLIKYQMKNVYIKESVKEENVLCETSYTSCAGLCYSKFLSPLPRLQRVNVRIKFIRQRSEFTLVK